VFTNKHVIVALIIAPVLSILAWLAVGSFTGEQAQPAQVGKSYPLLEKSNCRYPSGQCELENEDFSIILRINLLQELTVISAFPLDGVRVALVKSGVTDDQGKAMRKIDAEGLHWSMPLYELPEADARILLAAGAGGSTWFGDAATLFAQPEDAVIPNPR
jgi:hypothetical protein